MKICVTFGSGFVFNSYKIWTTIFSTNIHDVRLNLCILIKKVGLTENRGFRKERRVVKRPQDQYRAGHRLKSSATYT
jgi:hypothetical protein